MFLSILSSLLITVSASHAAGTNTFECANDRKDKINLTIDNDLLLTADKWVISGDDGTNPFDCNYRRQAESGNFVYGCASYQGAPYGYLSIDKNFFQTMKVRFVYIDENDFRIKDNVSATCTLKTGEIPK